MALQIPPLSLTVASKFSSSQTFWVTSDSSARGESEDRITLTFNRTCYWWRFCCTSFCPITWRRGFDLNVTASRQQRCKVSQMIFCYYLCPGSITTNYHHSPYPLRSNFCAHLCLSLPTISKQTFLFHIELFLLIHEIRIKGISSNNFP